MVTISWRRHRVENFENSCSVFFYRLRKIRVVFFVLFVLDDGNGKKELKEKTKINLKYFFVSSDQTGGGTRPQTREW